jgi:uncharacterized protein (DUF58 family)
MARRRWSFFMSPLEHGFLRRLDDAWRSLLTPSGRMLTVGTTVAAVMLLGGVVAPVVWLFSAGAALLGAGLAVGLLFRPRLQLERQLPPPASAGEVMTYRVRVHNQGRRPARLVAVQERNLPADLRPVGEPPVLETVAPGETREVSLQLRCVSRGAYTLGRLQAASAFPSGLVRWGAASSRADRVLVYPRVQHLEPFEVPNGRTYQPGGISIASHVGDSAEFLGTREWREGDRLRDVHWASSARVGRWVVKEYQEEYFVHLALVLDVEARNARDEALFEKSLCLAAGIAESLARRDFLIDVLAAGRSVYRLQAGRALAHVEHILELLAALEPDMQFDPAALEAELLPEAPKLSGVVLVALKWDGRRAAVAEALRARGVPVRVVAMRGDERPAGFSAEEWVTPS